VPPHLHNLSLVISKHEPHFSFCEMEIDRLLRRVYGTKPKFMERFVIFYLDCPSCDFETSLGTSVLCFPFSLLTLRKWDCRYVSLGFGVVFLIGRLGYPRSLGAVDNGAPHDPLLLAFFFVIYFFPSFAPVHRLASNLSLLLRSRGVFSFACSQSTSQTMDAFLSSPVPLLSSARLSVIRAGLPRAVPVPFNFSVLPLLLANEDSFSQD